MAIDFAALIASRKSGFTLPAPFYLDPEVFARDVELIFGRHWIYVGVEPEIAEPGDFFTVEIGSVSIIIVRDDDLTVRAFHNVCRHRAAAVVRGDTGNCGHAGFFETLPAQDARIAGCARPAARIRIIAAMRQAEVESQLGR